jgi:hypothetical protein
MSDDIRRAVDAFRDEFVEGLPHDEQVRLLALYSFFDAELTGLVPYGSADDPFGKDSSYYRNDTEDVFGSDSDAYGPDDLEPDDLGAPRDTDPATADAWRIFNAGIKEVHDRAKWRLFSDCHAEKMLDGEFEKVSPLASRASEVGFDLSVSLECGDPFGELAFARAVDDVRLNVDSGFVDGFGPVEALIASKELAALIAAGEEPVGRRSGRI